MRLYVKQNAVSWGDMLRVYDENGVAMYYAVGEVFSFGKKIHLYNVDGSELASVHQHIFTFRPTYTISKNGNDITKVVKKFSFFRHEYSVDSFGWTVSGNFHAHEYGIYSHGKTVAGISKRLFAWGDTYEIHISDDADTEIVLCTVLVIYSMMVRRFAGVAASDTANNR